MFFFNCVCVSLFVFVCQRASVFISLSLSLLQGISINSPRMYALSFAESPWHCLFGFTDSTMQMSVHSFSDIRVTNSQIIVKKNVSLLFSYLIRSHLDYFTSSEASYLLPNTKSWSNTEMFIENTANPGCIFLLHNWSGLPSSSLYYFWLTSKPTFFAAKLIVQITWSKYLFLWCFFFLLMYFRFPLTFLFAGLTYHRSTY